MASQADSAAQAGVAIPELSNGAAQANGKKTKLHGRAFYESIGSPKMVLAPMVEQSEFVRLPSSSLATAEHGS
jgi:tRNA-dihydrouridine synthase 1